MIIEVLYKCENCGIINYNDILESYDIGGSYSKCKKCGSESIEYIISNVREIRKLKLQNIKSLT